MARGIHANDSESLHKLVKANLRFVVSIAKEYAHYGVPLEDLINEGNLGLLKAAQRFDETRGFKFISYAVWWIRQSILAALANHSKIVRMPLNRARVLNQIKKASGELQQKLRRIPGIRIIPVLRPALPGGGQFPVEFILASTADEDRILQLAQQIQFKALQSGMFAFPPIIDVKIDQPQAEIIIDRDKAAD